MNSHKAANTSTTQQTSSGEAQIGGAFDLVDQNNQQFTDQKLLGKYTLVYFGFTKCPDICPLTLSNITLAYNELTDAEKAKFQILFITADPENDKPENMKEYLKNYNAPITGLTGTMPQIQQAEAAYKVYAQKVGAEVNHSSIIYVMDKNGKFISNFSAESKVAEITTKLKTIAQ